MIGNFTRYYKPYKLTLYAVVIGSLLAAGLDLIFPMAVRYVLNVVVPQQNMGDLLFYTVALTILYLFNYLILFFVSYVGHMLSARMENDMRSDLFTHMQSMSFKYFDNVTKSSSVKEASVPKCLSRFTIILFHELAGRSPG